MQKYLCLALHKLESSAQKSEKYLFSWHMASYSHSILCETPRRGETSQLEQNNLIISFHNFIL